MLKTTLSRPLLLRHRVIAPKARLVTEAVVVERRACGIRDDDSSVGLRSEALAPFRVVRLALYGSGVVGGGVGLLVNLTQVAAAAAGRPGAFSPKTVLTNIAIDVVAVLFCGFLAQKEWTDRVKQINRLSRESRLGKLTVETMTKKLLSLSDVRGVARVVIVAGSSEQISQALEAAEPYRSKLSEAGVYIVEVPISGEVVEEELVDVGKDKRWRGRAVRMDEWKEWFHDQMADSKATLDAGLYVGLRMDGRVRASGKGMPPWFRIANELPPLEGPWKGFGDGFDGPV